MEFRHTSDRRAYETSYAETNHDDSERRSDLIDIDRIGH
jgi:hypothetical protein